MLFHNSSSCRTCSSGWWCFSLSNECVHCIQLAVMIHHEQGLDKLLMNDDQW